MGLNGGGDRGPQCGGGRRGTSGGERLGEAVAELEDWVIVRFVSTAECASNQPTGHFIENGRIEK